MPDTPRSDISAFFTSLVDALARFAQSSAAFSTTRSGESGAGALPRGTLLPEGRDLAQAETSLLGVGDELELFQRGEVITSRASYPLRWRQDADLFVVAQSRWTHPCSGMGG
jgi:hypothetical protein